jgi:uncharacterized membrane protein (DUF373 family)
MGARNCEIEPTQETGMSEPKHHSEHSAEAGFSPAVVKTLELLDNSAHVIVAALFIIMAATVLVHTCFILARQVPLMTNLPPERQQAAIVSHETQAAATSHESQGSAAVAPHESQQVASEESAENKAPATMVADKSVEAASHEGHEGNTNLADPFYKLSLDLLSSILFAVIILELLRTIITYLQTHNIQAIMQEFLVVGIISSVRKILLVGAEASLSGSSGMAFIQEAVGVALNILGILLLIVGLFMLRRVGDKKEEAAS